MEDKQLPKHSGNQRLFQPDAGFLDLCQALSPLLLEQSKDPSDNPQEDVLDSSPSRKEWIRLKREDRAESESLDKLMCIVGLEDAKVTFLHTRFRVQTAWKQGRALSSEDLDIGIIGNGGTGKSTVAVLYKQFLRELGVSGNAYTYNLGQPVDARIRLELPDYTDDELLRILVAIIAETKWKIKGGPNGGYLHMLVRAVGRARGKGFRNVYALKEAWEKALKRQAERLRKEQQLGNHPDGLLLTKDDLIGPNPARDQLRRTLDWKLREQGVQATGWAREVAMQVLGNAHKRSDFSNNGDVESIVSRAKGVYEERALGKQQLGTAGEIILEPQDFDPDYSRHLQATAQFDAHFQRMIGMGSIAAQLKGYLKAIAGMRRCGVDPRPYIPFTFVFRGPPGVGKTFTAHKLGEIYHNMGLLSAADVVECSISDLITRYQGQTGRRVMGPLAQALGRVLFIDAYRLVGSEYEKQVFDELLESLAMVRCKENLVLVLSGDSQGLIRLMEVNSGLRSCSPATIVFNPLSPDDCWRLLREELDRVGIQIDESRAVGATPTEIFSRLAAMRSWANMRDVKRLAGEIIRQVSGEYSNNSGLCVSMQMIVWKLELAELDMAVAEAETEAVQADKETPGWPSMLDKIAQRLFDRHERTGSLRDLEAAITNTTLALDATPGDNPYHTAYLSSLSIYLSSYHAQTGSLQHLEAAIMNASLALEATSQEHPGYASLLSNLSYYLSSLYKQTGSLQDLEAAIRNASLAVDAIPQNNPDRAVCLSHLSSSLFQRYGQTGSLQDLEAAIKNVNLALDVTPREHPNHPDYLNNLSSCLLRRYEQTGSLQDLEAATTNANLAMVATAEKHPHRARMLMNLSSCLSNHYKQDGRSQDLEAAITYANQAVDITPQDHPDRARCLNNLSSQLSRRYERTRSMPDLEAAIMNANLAVDAAPKGHPDYAHCLNNLSIYLSSRYKQTGSMQDLEDAVINANQAVNATSEDHPDRAGRLNNLSSQLFHRYERTGSRQDLEDAIINANLALDTASQDHLDRARYLNNLSGYLSSHYKQTGNLQDLEAAIMNANLAVAATPGDHPDHARYLNNLSIYLSIRYKRTGSLQDLENAVINANLAVDATPEDRPHRANFLNNLSSCLLSRYEQSRSLEDLEAAILNANLAVDATPEDHPDHAHYLNNLSIYLSSRHLETGSLQDLEAAIMNANLAVDAMPQDNPDCAFCHSHLSSCLFRRYEQTGNLQDFESALQHIVTSANMPNALPLERIKHARQAIRVLWPQGEWNAAMMLAKNAVQLLPLVCSRYLSRDDQQYAITQTAGLAADACSIFLQLGQPERALQTLEFGRSLILGYLIDSRSDVDQLQNDHPALAKQYDRLRFILSQPLDSVLPEQKDQLLQEKRNAPHELEKCLNAIRQLKGHENFLLETSVSDLTSQAIEGPIVVVNITDFGAHAIIIQENDIRSLPLPDMLQTSNFALNDQIQLYRSVGEHGPGSRDIQGETVPFGSLQDVHTLRYNTECLQWLWYQCVKPIIRETTTLSPSILPRIWWIGAGVASSLPFHAAGDHDHPNENTVSHAVSSYTPTIKALAYSRSRLARIPSQEPITSIFIAAMPTTPNKQPLPGVEPEVNAIQQASQHVYTIHLQKHPAPETVLNAMKDTDIIHFACHGSSDPINPSDSHLVLRDSGSSTPTIGKLTVQQISDHASSRARIAYLSACSTAQVTASKLADEAIHLASAFQVAGFGHVIASLWSVDDAACARIAGYFYGYLVKHQAGALSNRLVAEALHAAVLRIRSEEDPSVWASYIHYGA
ncbi:CHAT domain-containing protein [Aspergillus terricola var. indicus]